MMLNIYQTVVVSKLQLKFKCSYQVSLYLWSRASFRLIFSHLHPILGCWKCAPKSQNYLIRTICKTVYTEWKMVTILILLSWFGKHVSLENTYIHIIQYFMKNWWVVLEMMGTQEKLDLYHSYHTDWIWRQIIKNQLQLYINHTENF